MPNEARLANASAAAPPIIANLRVNSPNGKFTGLVTEVSMPGVIHLRAPEKSDGLPINIRGGKGERLEIDGLFVRLKGHKARAVFPLWDEARISASAASHIINLLKRNQWEAVQGDAALVSRYNAGNRIRKIDVEKDDT